MKDEMEYYRSLRGDAALKERLKGRLPIINIAGHPFDVDLRMRLLRPKDNCLSPGLDIGMDAPYNYKTGMFEYYYHTKRMKEVDIDPKATSLPKNVVWVQVTGCEHDLDPVGLARRENERFDFYLDQCPLKMYSEATVTALKDSPIGKRILRRMQINPNKKKAPNQRKKLKR